MFQHICVTVLQQCHICPLPLEHLPIYWQYDHALHLYPAPDVIVLADSTPQATIEFGGCCFINPVRLCFQSKPEALQNNSSHVPATWRQLMVLLTWVWRVQGAFRTAAFAAYNPAEREVELSEIPPPD